MWTLKVDLAELGGRPIGPTPLVTGLTTLIH